MPTTPTTMDRLAQMARLYQRCLELTEQILTESASTDGDEDRLDVFLKRRAELIRKADALERELAVQDANGKRYLADLLPEDTDQARDLLDLIQETIRKIITADRRLMERYREVQDRVTEELGRLHQGLTLLKGYAPFKNGVAYYVDRRD